MQRKELNNMHVKKAISVISSAVSMLLLIVLPVFAHVTVKPNQANVAAFQTFTMGVPTEKDIPTVALRLVMPDGLNYVSPNVKPGWTITTKKEGEGEGAKVTEIEWTGGSIPAGQRDEFLFSAQVPADETTITWKAYQTYEDGTVVSWDQNPDSLKNLSDAQKEENEKKGVGPYSQTKVVNDLATSTDTTSVTKADLANNTSFLITISGLSLILSAVAIYMVLTKKK